MLRATASAAVLTIVFAANASATELKIPPPSAAVMTCDSVRAIVAERGLQGAYEWAKRRGYSDLQIGEAMKCLR